MSKIFDALENAQKEGIASNLPVEPPPLPSISLPVDNQRNRAEIRYGTGNAHPVPDDYRCTS